MFTTLGVHDVTSIIIGQPETCMRMSDGTFSTRKIRVFTKTDFVDITLFAADDDAANLLTLAERAATPAPTPEVAA